MRVLIVEDDRSLGLFLQKGLKLEGHEAQWVEDGETALEYVQSFQPDLMVLDLGLPVRDGVDILKDIRALGCDVAVLILTGRGGAEECIQCLDLGADDFLVKPFSFHELTARCRAILRRLKTVADASLQHGALWMDRIRRKVTCHGRGIDLTSREFALLESLMKRKGGCCTREQLLEEVWQMAPEGTANNVDVYITYLRRKLAAVATPGTQVESMIQTIRGVGYRLQQPSSVGTAADYSGLQFAKGA